MEEDTTVWRKRQEFSLDTGFEVMVGQFSRGVWETVGNRGRFNGRGRFQERSLVPNASIRKVK